MMGNMEIVEAQIPFETGGGWVQAILEDGGRTTL
jgi:hypothetical protein